MPVDLIIGMGVMAKSGIFLALDHCHEGKNA